MNKKSLTKTKNRNNLHYKKRGRLKKEKEEQRRKDVAKQRAEASGGMKEKDEAMQQEQGREQPGFSVAKVFTQKYPELALLPQNQKDQRNYLRSLRGLPPAS